MHKTIKHALSDFLSERSIAFFIADAAMFVILCMIKIYESINLKNPSNN